MTMTIVDTIWVCTCCMLSHANGKCCEDHAREASERVTEPGNFYTGPIAPEPMPWALYAAPGAYRHVAMGGGHAEGCPNGPDGPRDTDCDCETRESSRSSCDGCGSVLHGTRHAFTVFDS